MLEARGLRRLGVGPVDLRLDDGQCLCVSGPSGAGKSVLLRMLADLDPHEGDCSLDGQACSAMRAPAWRHLVTYVAADAGWWHPQVGEHFAAGIDFATLLPQLGIAAEAAGWPVSRLSTGERQRLALLRALRPQTRLLLLDEPTSGLDPDNVARVEAVLIRALERGCSIVMVTHDPAQARRMGSRQATLNAGRLLHDRP